VSRDESLDLIRQECWDRALYAHGTARIFEDRARQTARYRRLLTFLGIVVPVAVGGVILSFGTTSGWLPHLLAAAGALSVVQLVSSVWSLTARWDERLAYARESASENYRLSEQFRKLGADPPSDARLRFEILEVAYQARQAADYKEDVTPEEKRKGYCAGLLRFRRECTQCGRIPGSMKASSCPMCGDF